MANECPCSKCGCDLSRTMKFYDNTANRYCYECFQKAFPKPERKKKPVRPMSTNQKIKTLYYKGKKPSEIAAELGISTSAVYDVLNERR